jgi:hypothetical protein
VGGIVVGLKESILRGEMPKAQVSAAGVAIVRNHPGQLITSALRVTSYTEEGGRHLARARRECLWSFAALAVSIVAWVGLALMR